MDGGVVMLNVTLNACSFAVDKNRPNKATGCQQPLRQEQQQQQQPKSTRSHGAAVGLVPAADTQQNRQLQVQCEALAVVLQKTLAEVRPWLASNGTGV